MFRLWYVSLQHILRSGLSTVRIKLERILIYMTHIDLFSATRGYMINESMKYWEKI